MDSSQLDPPIDLTWQDRLYNVQRTHVVGKYAFQVSCDFIYRNEFSADSLKVPLGLVTSAQIESIISSRRGGPLDSNILVKLHHRISQRAVLRVSMPSLFTLYGTVNDPPQIKAPVFSRWNAVTSLDYDIGVGK